MRESDRNGNVVSDRGFPTGVSIALLSAVLVVAGVTTSGTQRGVPTPLADGPWTFRSGDMPFRVSTVTRGLMRPWSMAFLPDGSMLVTEREGRLRVIRNGVLDPQPVAGVPEVYAVRLDGLLDIALHPDFAANRLVYLSYSKPGPDLAPGAQSLASQLPGPPAQGARGRTKTDAIWRARWDGTALVDGKDIFVADNWLDDTISQTSAVRMVFGRDGMLYVVLGAPNAPAASGRYAHARGGRAQDPGSHGGKSLRLTEDGGVPRDNPFLNRPGYKPEIFTLGHRNALGLAVHPVTGEIWSHENGPADGDEINILRAGANYGWPVVGIGRDYTGDCIGGKVAIGETAGRPDACQVFSLPGMESPVSFWAPAVAPSGMEFYTGDRLPRFTGSLFVGVLKNQRLERYSFNAQGFISRPEWLLEDLKQRLRDVREGPDGLLYILTDEDTGALLRIEPVSGAR